jgi:Ca2+-binding RTX toxin-like protein
VIAGTRAGTLNVFGIAPIDIAATANVLQDIETVIGTRYDDRIIGDATNTTLQGRGGRDTLDGGAGDDILDGGAGRDLLTGGDGADRFRFSTNWGADTITDLSSTDILDFRSVRNLTKSEQFTITDLSNGLAIEVDRGGSIEIQGIDRASWNAMLADGNILY